MFDAQRVVATASGPTFATEGAGVNILLLTGMRLHSVSATMPWLCAVRY